MKDKNYFLLVSEQATSKLSTHIQTGIFKIKQEQSNAQCMPCFDEQNTILFNGFKLCVIYVALDRTWFWLRQNLLPSTWYSPAF